MKREEKGADCITREEYLEYLIHTYQNLIFSICLKSVGNPFDAEDLTQDVFFPPTKISPVLMAPTKKPGSARSQSENAWII